MENENFEKRLEELEELEGLTNSDYIEQKEDLTDLIYVENLIDGAKIAKKAIENLRARLLTDEQIKNLENLKDKNIAEFLAFNDFEIYGNFIIIPEFYKKIVEKYEDYLYSGVVEHGYDYDNENEISCYVNDSILGLHDNPNFEDLQKLNENEVEYIIDSITTLTIEELRKFD